MRALLSAQPVIRQTLYLKDLSLQASALCQEILCGLGNAAKVQIILNSSRLFIFFPQGIPVRVCRLPVIQGCVAGSELSWVLSACVRPSSHPGSVWRVRLALWYSHPQDLPLGLLACLLVCSGPKQDLHLRLQSCGLSPFISYQMHYFC